MSLLESKHHPIYSGVALPWQERFQLGRRYGKYDFGRFERLEGSNHYLGKGKIGDVDVACRFRFRESRWGVLTPDKNPGGVVYLDLTFTEPQECRLRGATILLTLDEKDEDLRRHFSAENPSTNVKVPVQITKHGPQILHGQLDEALKIEKNSFTPWIDAGGFAGAGGIGRNSEKRYIQRSQWKFSSQPIPNRFQKATTLRWDLVESELDRQPRHDNTFHTAFAFEHDGQPFFMQVEVAGCLEGIASHIRQKAKQKFKRFKFGIEPQSATTLVNFGGRNNPYQDPLDELAQKIPEDMMERNRKPVAQIQGNQPVSGPDYEIVDEGDSSQTGQEDDLHVQSPPPQRIENSHSVALEEIQGEALALLSLDRPSIGEYRLDRTTEILLPVDHQQRQSCDGRLSAPDIQPGQSTASSTIVDQEQDEGTRRITLIEPNANHEEVRRLLSEAALPTVLQLMILWLLAVGMKISLLSKKIDLPRAGKA
ncbi:uncharacterized protein GGS22DRAFT_66170 [Annulohypoxylon maeteangense]|uniref:uncharacterized protein n=1 Tax=Annulohypoxylon maeteangense TaxID=1927788 RepID=UPI002007C6D1|nr:uncharacterized protein GGS22DRAFT_66170 [Annulohypoxylon maeteangense]KAI0889021.1 hypothetical protein GGS22DRAFT_66170 [Annulohypoxylon maeteangense]